MALGAHYQINQAANSTPTGTTDVARIDIYQSQLVHLVGDSSSAQVSPVWTILAWPEGAAHTQPTNPTTFDATYTFPTPGSYLIEFLVNNGLGVNATRFVVGVTRDANGLVYDDGVREPVFGERLGDDTASSNDRGWAKAYETALARAMPAISTVAALEAMRPNRHKHVHLLGYYAPGDGGGGDMYWDATSTATRNGGTVFQPGFGGAGAMATGRWIRRYTGPIQLEWFGAKADVHETTCATVAGSRVITVSHSDALNARVGQTIWIRAVYSHDNYTVLALTGVQTGYDAASPPGSRNYPIGWPAHGAGTDPFPYDISTTAVVANQLLVSPKHMHRYIEIPAISYRGYVSDIGGPEMNGMRRSVMGFDTNTEKVFRISENLNDGSDPSPGSAMTATLGADNLVGTILSIDTSANTITLSGGDPLCGATFTKTDVVWFTAADSALTAAFTAGNVVELSHQYGLRAFAHNNDSQTLRWHRGAQFYLTGSFVMNGNRCHYRGNQHTLTQGGATSNLVEFVWLGQMKQVAIHQAQGSGGPAQQAFGDLVHDITVWNKYLTPHSIGWKTGQFVDEIGSYGPGGASWFGTGILDFHAGAGIGFHNSQAVQQAYHYGIKMTPTLSTQNGSGGNLGRGFGYVSGTVGLGANTATWISDYTMQGFPVQFNIRGADTTEIRDGVGEDMCPIGSVTFKVEFALRFDVGGQHFEDTGLIGRWVDPRAQINRNRFMVLGQAETNVHVQFAAGAAINATTGLSIDRGPRRLKVRFNSGTIAAGSVTVTGTDYCGDPISETFAPNPGAGPVTIEGDGRILFDVVTQITSTVDMGVTVDVLQAGSSVYDAHVSDSHRIGGVSVCYERINCDTFTSTDNGIIMVNETAAYPAVYFLATDTGNSRVRVRLEHDSIGLNTLGVYLADASFNPVATIAGLEYQSDSFNGNEFAPKDNVSHPTHKFAGKICHAGGTGPLAMIIDSRLSDGTQVGNGHFKGLWEFDSVGKFNAGITVVGNFSGTGGTLNWHDVGAPIFFVIDTSGLLVFPEHVAVASGNPYGDGSNVLQRTTLDLRHGFWDPTGTPQARTIDTLLQATFDTRQTDPLVHLDLSLGAKCTLTVWYDANGTSLALGTAGVGAARLEMAFATDPPVHTRPVGSICSTASGNMFISQGAGTWKKVTAV